MFSKKKIRLLGLGGIGEIGKSCYVIEYGNSMLMVDCGLAFPDIHLLGVDLVIPDFTYLLRNRGKLKAILLTHGHEDHIGALPFLLSDFVPPAIYGSKITLGLLRSKIEEVGFEGELPLREMSAGDVLPINEDIKVEAFHISHSIPDELAFGITTPIGKIFFSGDFKIDRSPVDGKPTDLGKIRAFAGEEGVLALLTDATNIERPGWTGSESEVGPALWDYFHSHPGRILITTFASNIHRVQQVLDIAYECGRKVFLAGRAMLTNTALARDLGYLRIPPDTLIDPPLLNRVPPKNLVILATGSQGEPMAALTQMSKNQHRFVTIQEGDLVLFSASPIPGNETYIFSVIDDLFRLNAEVVYGRESKVHVSGHGSQDEIKELIRATRPKYLIPIHSEYRHQMIFKKLAEKWGHPQGNIIILELGEVLELDEEGWEIREHVKAGATYIDGLSVGAVSTRILSERTALAEDGVVTFTVVLDTQGDLIITGPIIKARGFPAESDDPSLYQAMRELISESILRNRQRSREFQIQLRNNISNALQRFIFEKLGLSPVIMGTVIHIDAESIPALIRDTYGASES